jgi:aromatic-L-amino-acid decarboxylase
MPVSASKDASLDPADWEDFRELAHEAVDDTIDLLRTLRERPAWSRIPDKVVGQLQAPVPWEGSSERIAYEEFRSLIEPYTNGNRHPRFFGWVQGCGIPLASLAEFLASSMNPHMAGFTQSGPIVEAQVLDWMKAFIRYPPDSSGILLSGGTMANITGLAIARVARHPGNYRMEGLQNRDMGRMVFYGSSETHGWAGKAAEWLGLGRASYSTLPVDADYQISLTALRTTIEADRSAGRVPFCVIANAGTINTGAIDPLADLADLCELEGLWLHVDGAYGALAAATTKYGALLKGLDRADSVAFDLHKWFYLPFEIGCLLVRDADRHRQTFAAEGAYIEGHKRGVIEAGLPFAHLGIELTRGFKALKAWMCCKAYGLDRFAAAIQRNVDDIQAIVRVIDSTRELERLAPAPLNVVCFRYKAAGLTDAELNALNEEILYRIQESGVGVPSSTTLNGIVALRLANVNHRATFSDLLVIVEAVVACGAALRAAA